MDLVKTDIPEDTYLVGVGVSPGIAIGRTFLLERRMRAVERAVLPEQVEEEIDRFHQALQSARDQLTAIQQKAAERPELIEHLYIIDTHLMILGDDMLVGGTCKKIEECCINAEGALKRTQDEFRTVFESVADEYLRERVSDIDAVAARIFRALSGQDDTSPADIDHKAVIVAHDLSPADTMQIDKSKTIGFVIDCGGRTSHTAILARSLGIPAVVGLENITEITYKSGPIVIDGHTGTVILNPSDDTFKEYLKKKQAYEYLEKELRSYCDLPATTQDGFNVQVMGNVELETEVAPAREYGAEGIGLYRTEFLFMNRTELPSEEEQVEAYSAIVKAMAPQSVTIRTLDLGGDKYLPGLDLEDEDNPAMGLRAIRLSLKESDLFKGQLRAILRASAYGSVRIMFPMVTGVAEVRNCRRLLDLAKQELSEEGYDFDSDVSIGIMIETPAAVMIAPMLAKEVDFFSVGTNDLIQYCLAVDRGNEHVAYLYEPLHPAVLRALKMVCDAGKQAQIGVSLCGEMASEPMYTLVLLGLGFDELSMNPPAIARIKQVLRQVNRVDGQALLDELFELQTACEVAQRIEEEMCRRFPTIFGGGSTEVLGS